MILFLLVLVGGFGITSCEQETVELHHDPSIKDKSGKEYNLESRSLNGSSLNPILSPNQDMLSFSSEQDFTDAIEILSNEEESFLSYIESEYPEVSDEDYDNIILQARATDQAPLEEFVSILGDQSLYTKYYSIEIGEATLGGIDTFAIDLFISKPIRALLNSDFKVMINGVERDILAEAFDCSTRECAESEILNRTPSTCTNIFRKVNEFGYSYGGYDRRFKIKSSLLPILAVSVITVDFTNEIKKKGKWKRTRDNLQLGGSGKVRDTYLCGDRYNWSYTTPVKYLESIELRRVHPRDIAKTISEWTNVANNSVHSVVNSY